MIIENLLLFLAALGVLVFSGGWLIRLLVKLSSRLGLSQFLVAFIIMAFATSIPELFVGINSALRGNPTLAFGNVIGANIANLTLVIGISALVGKGLKSRSKYLKKDLILMFLFALAPLILLFLGKELSRIDGVILLVLFFGYVYYLIRNRRNPGKIKYKGRGKLGILLVSFAIAITMLFISAHLVVKNAEILSAELYLPPIIIGLFLISLGTALPELIVGIKAAMQRKPDLALGDCMGSVVANSTLVLGATALIMPITDSSVIFLISAVYMMIVCIAFSAFLIKQRGLNILSGIILVCMYAFFIALGFLFKLI